MLQFLQSLSPEQISLIAGVVVASLHYFLDKWRDFTSTHNWILSFVFPLLGVGAAYLATNASFTEAFPLYASVYATSQFLYATVLRKYNEVNSLKAKLTEVTI